MTAKFKNLTFVTNSIAIALKSRGGEILLGGKSNGEYQFAYGADRIDCLVTSETPDPELEKLKKLGVRIEFA